MITFEESTHTYRDSDGDVVPSVTQILKPLDTTFDRVNKDVLDARAMLGKAVHLATELYDKGVLDWESLHPKVRPYLDQYINFKKAKKVEVIANEQLVYHEGMNYAGTLDRIITMDGLPKQYVLDFKIGVPTHWHQIQLAGYQLAVNNAGGSVAGRCGLYLRPDKYRYEPFDDPADRSVFIGAVSIYHFKDRKGIK